MYEYTFLPCFKQILGCIFAGSAANRMETSDLTPLDLLFLGQQRCWGTLEVRCQKALRSYFGAPNIAVAPSRGLGPNFIQNLFLGNVVLHR